MAQGIFSLSDILLFDSGNGIGFGDSWQLQGGSLPASILQHSDYSYYTGGQITGIGAVTFTERLSFSTETLTYVPSAQTSISRYYATSVSNESYSLILSGENLDQLIPGKYTTTIEKLTYSTSTVSIDTSSNLLFGFSKGAAISDGTDDSDFFVAGGEQIDSLGTNNIGTGVYRLDYSTGTMERYVAYYQSVGWSNFTNTQVRDVYDDIITYYNANTHSSSYDFTCDVDFFQQSLSDSRVSLSGGNLGNFGIFVGGYNTSSRWSFNIDFLDFRTGTVFKLPFLYANLQECLPADITGTSLSDGQSEALLSSYNTLVLGVNSNFTRPPETYMYTTPAFEDFPKDEGLHQVNTSSFSTYASVGGYLSTFNAGGLPFTYTTQGQGYREFTGFLQHPTRQYTLQALQYETALTYPVVTNGLQYTSIFGGSGHNKINHSTFTNSAVYTTTPLLNRPYKTSTGAIYDAFIAGGTSSSSVFERINYTVDTKSISSASLILPRFSMVGSGYFTRKISTFNGDLYILYPFFNFLASQPKSNSIFHLTETITQTSTPAANYGLIIGGFNSNILQSTWFNSTDDGDVTSSIGGVRYESQKWNFTTEGFSLSTNSATSEARCSLATASNSTHGYLSGGGQASLILGFYPNVATYFSSSLMEKVSYTIETTKIAPSASNTQCRTGHSGLSNLSTAYWIGGYAVSSDYSDVAAFYHLHPSGNYRSFTYITHGFSTSFLTEKTTFSTDSTSLLTSNGDYRYGVRHGSTSFGNLSEGYIIGGAVAPFANNTGIHVSQWDPPSASYYGIKFTYSTETQSDYSSSNLSTPKYSTQSVANSNNAYIIGGKDTNQGILNADGTNTVPLGLISTIEKLSFSTGTVSTISGNCEDRYLGSTLGHTDYAVIVGGKYGEASFHATEVTEKLVYSTDTISSLPSSKELINYVQDAGSLSARANGLPSTSSTTVSYS